MFENVNYTYYREALGRSAIPDEEAFNCLTEDNKLFVKRLVAGGIVWETEENGIDSAVCRMAELDYLAGQQAGGGEETGGAIASESINGYSYSYDRTAQQETAKLDAKSTAAKKIDIIKLYCGWDAGVR